MRRWLAAVVTVAAFCAVPATSDATSASHARTAPVPATVAPVDRTAQVQYILLSHGYVGIGPVDGVYGPLTRRAVMKWQRANGLLVDGIVGPVTWASLIGSIEVAALPLRPAVRVDPPNTAPQVQDSGDVEAIIRSVWPAELADHAVAIATRESRLVPTARNSCCWGLFQIYWSVHQSWLAAMGVTSPSQLLDARTNAEAAWALYQRAGGWAPWAT